jgi:hypothetical protein
VTLGELRAAVAAALTPLNADWTVFDAPVDSLEPPAFVLVWADPWLVPETWCQSAAQLDVVCVPARMEPEANYPTLEAMVAQANTALKTFPVVQTGTPGPFEVAGVTYLAARILIRQPVAIP